jgi:hypothetical protein
MCGSRRIVSATVYLIPRQQEAIMAKDMTLKEMKAELKRLNKFIEDHEEARDTGFTVYPNVVNTEKFGTEYSYVKLPKDALELRKQLKAIRYGKTGRGKARWMKDEGAWSIVTSALVGTKFA